jgi:uncharacterized membrane protein
MATDRFSKSEAIEFGWNTMKANFGFFIGITIIVLIYSLFQFLNHYMIENNDLSLFYFVTPIIYLIINSVIKIGLIKISLRFCDNQKGKFSDLFSSLHLFFKYFGASLLYVLIIAGGMLLLIVPGVIWAIKFQYYGYFIVDKGLGPIKALEASSELTEGVKWDLFLFGWLLGCIDLLGLLCLGIGLFATIPTTIIANAFVYRKLESELKVVQIPTGA